MAYTDLSSTFILDHLFSFSDADELSENDKHIKDTIAIEHNWNASSIDGTHGAITATGITLASGATITLNTSDTSDNSKLGIGGGGAVSDTRGGSISLYGNEHASFPGKAMLVAGDGSGNNGIVQISTTLGSIQITYDGLMTLSTTTNNFILKQNSVNVMTSVGTSAVVDTLYLKQGKVGIGTASPNERLEVSGADPRIFLDNISSTDGVSRTHLKFGNAGTDHFVTGHLFDSTDGDNRYQIMKGDLTPLVTVMKDGKVGIGTTGPDAKLDVLSTTEQLRLTYTDGSVYTSFTVDASGNLSISPTGKLAIGVTTNINCTLTLASDACIGINTVDASDDGSLVLSGAGAEGITRGGYIKLHGNEDTGNEGRILLVAGDDSAQGQILMYTGAAALRVLISYAGDVGIGTTGPDAKLDVLSTSEQLRLTYTDGSVYASFTVSNGGALTIAPTGEFLLSQNSVNVIRSIETSAVINTLYLSSGHVSIGTASTAAKLYVRGGSSEANPVLSLDQQDINDTFIDFSGQTAADGSRSISSDTTQDSAKFGAFKIEINGVTKWVRVYDDHS